MSYRSRVTTAIAPDTLESLRFDAIGRAASWIPVKTGKRNRAVELKRMWREASDSIQDVVGRVRLFSENSRLLATVIRESGESVEASRDLPHVRVDADRVWPRAF